MTPEPVFDNSPRYNSELKQYELTLQLDADGRLDLGQERSIYVVEESSILDPKRFEGGYEFKVGQSSLRLGEPSDGSYSISRSIAQERVEIRVCWGGEFYLTLGDERRIDFKARVTEGPKGFVIEAFELKSASKFSIEDLGKAVSLLV